MRFTLRPLLIFCFTLQLACIIGRNSRSDDTNAHTIVLETDLPDLQVKPLDLGNLLSGKEYSFVLHIKNPSDTELRLHEIESSCGCMVVKPESDVLLPNSDLEVVFALAPFQREQKLGKAIILIFEKPGDSTRVRIRVDIQGFIRYAVSLGTDTVALRKSDAIEHGDIHRWSFPLSILDLQPGDSPKLSVSDASEVLSCRVEKTDVTYYLVIEGKKSALTQGFSIRGNLSLPSVKTSGPFRAVYIDDTAVRVFPEQYIIVQSESIQEVTFKLVLPDKQKSESVESWVFRLDDENLDDVSLNSISTRIVELKFKGIFNKPGSKVVLGTDPKSEFGVETRVVVVESERGKNHAW